VVIARLRSRMILLVENVMLSQETLQLDEKWPGFRMPPLSTGPKTLLGFFDPRSGNHLMAILL
jgi:hypothetical protein